ncbi:MAG: hypothetical protein EHM32_06030 [Spirochaetales bacterium]|nr:MAG: hypothetical protein EHM32_06030 [Spirochaetales bacterium]
MDKQMSVIGCVLAAALAAAPPPQIVHDVPVINIEVPVRVFQDNRFVDSLKKDDFEVLEDGVPQNIEAVYLVRKTRIVRKEGLSPETPRTSRLFVMLFEMTSYQPEIEGAIDYFFDRLIEPYDELILVTPLHTFHLKPDVFSATSRGKAKKDFLGKIRADVTVSGAEYRRLIRDLSEILAGDEDLDVKLQSYAETLRQIENIRYVDEKKLFEFARFLKSRGGQKHVFFFYQKEWVPRVNTKNIANLISSSFERPENLFDMTDKFESYNRDMTFDAREVKKAFSDSSMAVHFLYLTGSGPTTVDTYESSTSYMTLEEQSQDIFSAFSEIAKATGGLSDTSASAEQSFKRIAAAAENYYLLYYRPARFKPDGKFREISVRVKSKGFRVFHRSGYIAE